MYIYCFIGSLSLKESQGFAGKFYKDFRKKETHRDELLAIFCIGHNSYSLLTALK